MTLQEKSQKGLGLLKEAILETLETHPDGLRNANIAHILDIRSD